MGAIKVSELYNVGDPIDAIEGGHYARVFEVGPVAKADRLPETLAFKVMKLKHVLEPSSDREWKAFITETRALEAFQSHEMVPTFFDCGYLQVPPEHLASTQYPVTYELPKASYEIVSFGHNARYFAEVMPRYREWKWRPYIVEERILDEYCARGHINPIEAVSDLPEAYQRFTKRYPTLLVLAITSQFTDLLMYIQDKGFVYSDHKLAHTYWDWTQGKLRVIDWNGGTFFDTEKNAVMVVERKRDDCRDLIASVTYPLLTGFKKFPTDGPLPSTGTRAAGFNLPIPIRVGGRTLLQPFFDEIAKGKIADAHALRARLDSIMIQYGLRRASHNSANVEALDEIRTLYDRYGAIFSELEAFRQTVLGSLPPDSPVQFKEELQTMYAALEDLRKNWSIITKSTWKF